MSGTKPLAPASAAAPAVRFLADAFDAAVEPLGYDTLEKKAQLIGCAESTISRIRAGKSAPGSQFIAMVYIAAERLPDGSSGSDFFDFHGEPATA